MREYRSGKIADKSERQATRDSSGGRACAAPGRDAHADAGITRIAARESAFPFSAGGLQDAAVLIFQDLPQSHGHLAIADAFAGAARFREKILHAYFEKQELRPGMYPELGSLAVADLLRGGRDGDH